MRQQILSPIALSLFLALTLLFLLAYNPFFHNYLLSQSGTNQSLAQEVQGPMVRYLSLGPDTPPDISLFTPAERSHLHDVQRVLRGLLTLVFILAGVLMYMYRHGRITSDTLYRAGMVLTVTPIALALLPFETLFIWMHLLLFPQGNWMFPTSSALINVYTERFFFLFTLSWSGLIVGTGMLLLTISIIRKKTHTFRRTR